MRISDWSSDVCSSDLGFGRLANFINGELWGRPTDAPWGIVFPSAPDQLPRHPSQLYEFALEGVALFALLWFLFYKTDARKKPGMLVGTLLLAYGRPSSIIEFFGDPDVPLSTLP